MKFEITELGTREYTHTDVDGNTHTTTIVSEMLSNGEASVSFQYVAEQLVLMSDSLSTLREREWDKSVFNGEKREGSLTYQQWYNAVETLQDNEEEYGYGLDDADALREAFPEFQKTLTERRAHNIKVRAELRREENIRRGPEPSFYKKTNEMMLSIYDNGGQINGQSIDISEEDYARHLKWGRSKSHYESDFGMVAINVMVERDGQ